MDSKQRHSSVPTQAALSRHPPHHASRSRSASLRNHSDYSPEPSQPVSLVRVKGQSMMNTPPPRTTERIRACGQSPRKATSSGSPGTPRTPRAASPEAGASSLVNPSSVLLQDLLKEQRASRGTTSTRGPAEGADSVPQTPDRQSRARSHSYSQSNSQSQSQDDSAPPEKTRKVASALSAGLRQPREMGVREMDQYVSKINKQNFDLKLEIFHRAQQMAALEKRLEHMQELEDEVRRMRGIEDELQELRHAEEDNHRLRESNEQLRTELDKRDQAVTEAVELICQLEGRVDELKAQQGSRPTTSYSEGPDVATPKQRINIPERTSSRQATRENRSDRHLQCAPSFLRDEKNSTPVLRNLYVPSGDQSQSAVSVITKSESMNSMNEAEAASPRLSALSECSDLLPDDVPVVQDKYEPDDASRIESTAANSDTVGQNVEQRKREHIDQWMQPPPAMFAAHPSSKRKDSGYIAEFNNSTSDGELNPNDPRQRVRLDGLFGSRLPPTPDTMDTAYASRYNRSDGSFNADKAYKLGRPQSFDEPEKPGSPDSNTNDSHRVDEGSAVVRLGSLPPKQRRRASYQERQTAWPGMEYDRDNDTGVEKVLSRTGNDHHLPVSKTRSTKRHTLNIASSPPLSPQDWVEAANTPPRSKREDHRRQNTSIYNPSQRISAFHGRRHSADANIRYEPILDIRALESGPQPTRPAPAPTSGTTSRRRISFLQPLFSRLVHPRRLQPSPMDDDGAPAPVVPKARTTGPGPESPTIANTRCTVDSERAVLTHANAAPALPTYADPRTRELVSRTMPQAFAGRPTITTQSKEHKRRSSGIFGWMKEARSGKKSEPSSPATPSTTTSTPDLNSAARRRASVRAVPDAWVGSVGSGQQGRGPVGSGPATGSPLKDVPSAGSSSNSANSEVSLKQILREDSSLVRRPRYVERRRV